MANGSGVSGVVWLPTCCINPDGVITKFRQVITNRKYGAGCAIRLIFATGVGVTARIWALSKEW